MGANFVVVSTPFLHLGSGVVKVHEPVCVQALGAELAVEGLDEGVVGGLAGSAKVEDDALLIGPEIKVPTTRSPDPPGLTGDSRPGCRSVPKPEPRPRRDS